MPPAPPETNIDYLRALLEDAPGPDDYELAHLVDWATFWSQDKSDEDWLAYPLIPRGRAIAMFAPAKAGKSSVILALAAALACGRPIFGGVTVAPEHVLYLDYEMTDADLMERLTELGYTAADNLDHLHYALLPSMPPLDTPEGARAVLKLAKHVEAAVVVIDTFGRAVEGKESDADTVRAFYRYTGLMLKSAGCAVIRTDHAGKDLEKGQRGTSAKADDVDVVWQLSRIEEGVKLKRTHSRLSWVPDEITLHRAERDDGTVEWSIFSGAAFPAGTKEMVERLESTGVPVHASARKATEMLRAAGLKGSNAVVRGAQRARQQAHQIGPNMGGKPRRNVHGAVTNDETAAQSAAQSARLAKPQVDDSARFAARVGAVSEPIVTSAPLYNRGAVTAEANQEETTTIEESIF